MRAVLATSVAVLAVAAPAGAVSIPTSVSFSLAGRTEQAQKQEKTRSCQAGSRDKVIFHARHPQVVACEQPPKANLTTPDLIAKATAAALSVIG